MSIVIVLKEATTGLKGSFASLLSTFLYGRETRTEKNGNKIVADTIS